MNRVSGIKNITDNKDWDVIVIGGGATGLGIALDAVTRGYSTLLLEAKDFAKGTSSRSTKLVHGGVRYLAQGNLTLVREALRERGRLAQNAPHLFRKQAFIIPGESWWTAPYYTFGLWVYDRLAGKLSIGGTKHLSQTETKRRLEGVKPEKVHAGVCYYDGQFDDARLAIALAQSIIDNGGTALNYVAVTGLQKNADGQVNGVHAQDAFTGGEYTLNAKAVINATGVFANEILAMDTPDSKPRIVPSQGIHLVIDRKFMPSESALMVPKTSDGRVLFVVPWHDKLVVGTTDTPVKHADYEPKPIEQEVQFILDTAKEYLTLAPTREDVLSVFVGLRPLAAPEEEGKSTKEVSRSHKVEVANSKLVHIFGGKWTTYRQMAEDTLDAAIGARLLEKRPCKTADLKLHGYDRSLQLGDSPLSYYGSDAMNIVTLESEDTKLSQKIHPDFPYTFAQIEWAIQHEFAQTLEDILARRIRLLFLDAKAAGQAAVDIANFMADKLHWSDEKKAQEIINFNDLVKQYTL